MSTQEFPISKGYNPLFAVITKNDHAGYIIIACALGSALVLLSSFLRVFVRTAYGQGAGVDDALLSAATVFGFIESAITLGAAAKGLGTSIDLVKHSHILQLEQTFYIDHILTLVSLALAKCSVGFFILRLTPIKGQRGIVWGIMAFTALWMVASIFAMALQCNLSHPWILTGDVQCSGSYTRVIVIGIFDILIEVALVGTTAFMVAGLQAAIWTKRTVVTVFSFRLPLIVFTAMRIVRWDQAALTTNFTLDEDMYIVWTQIQIYYSLVSATIPSLRPFINNLTTYYGVGLTPNDRMTYGSYSLSANRSGRRYGTSKSIQLSNLSSSHRRRLEEESAIRKETRDPTFAGSNETHVYAKGNNGGLLRSGPSQIALRDAKSTDEASVGSNNSQRMIIRKDTQWVVERANVDMI